MHNPNGHLQLPKGHAKAASSQEHSSNSEKDVSQYWRTLKITGKIIEAKNLMTEKTEVCDPFCVAKIDNMSHNEVRSATMDATSSPFWAEDFTFENLRGLHDLKFVVWNDRKSKPGQIADKPLGRVVIPRDYLKGESEEWYTLTNAENEGSFLGLIRIRIRYFPAKGARKIHGFAVRVMSAKNLYQREANYMPNPFVVFHMLPDKDAISTQQTRVQNKTSNPVYSETFYFTFGPAEIADRELHCSVWDQGTGNESETVSFIGHITIPLNPIMKRIATDKWYSLQHLHTSIPGIGLASEKKPKNSRKKSLTDEEKRSRPRELVRVLHGQPEIPPPSLRRNHEFVETTFAFNSCVHCNGVMIGSQIQCSHCSAGIHSKCKEAFSPFCGSMGVLKLRIKITETVVLPLQLYSSFVNTIEANDFYLPYLLGRASQEREDAARNLLNIFTAKETVLEFLKSLARQEIEQASESKTLFRANSMASKAIDVFMKQVALKHLKVVLEDIITEVTTSGKGGEIDPTKIDKSEKPELILHNIMQLKEYNSKIVEAIFASVAAFPIVLKQLFSYMQKIVIEKFPNDPNARYTSVGGFVFLRFFAPAVLGPKLFGLDVGPIDAKASRILVLIAKTIQNLSNLVEFGQKEIYMAAMNNFIVGQVKSMKAYIDKICDPESSTTETPIRLAESFTTFAFSDPNQASSVARECAEVANIFGQSLDKMTSLDPTSELVRKLVEAYDGIQQIQQNLKKVEESANTVYGDIGFEANVDLLGEPTLREETKEEENERKVIRMLTRASSARSSQGSFRNSLDMRDSMIRGSSHNANLPLTPITPVQTNSLLQDVLKASTSRSGFPDEIPPGTSPNLNGSANESSSLAKGLSTLSKSSSKGELASLAGRDSKGVAPSPKPNRNDSRQATITARPFHTSEASEGSSSPKPVRKLDSKEPIASVKPSLLKQSTLKKSGSLSGLQESSDKKSTMSLKGEIDYCKCDDEEEDEELDLLAMLSGPPIPSATSTPVIPPKKGHKKNGSTANVNMCPICDKPKMPTEEELKDRASNSVSSMGSGFLRGAFSRSKPKKEKEVRRDPSESGSAHSLNSGNCARCQLEVGEVVVEVEGRKYHTECLTCSICSTTLTDFVLPYNNDIVCRPCFMKANGLQCGVCNLFIESAYLSINGKNFHVECRPCNKCGEILSKKDHFTLGDQVFCIDHKDSIITCSACSQKIDGSVLIAGSPPKFYHMNHFACSGCGKDLSNSVFYELGDRSWCQPCFLAKTDVPTDSDEFPEAQTVSSAIPS